MILDPLYLLNQRQYENGVLVKEILDGVEVTSNLGKTPLEVHGIIIFPIPYPEWPLWVKALAMIAKPEDKGVGDVLARTIGSENSEAFKKWYKTTTGKNCGCTGRQLRWNIEYPLNLKAT